MAAILSFYISVFFFVDVARLPEHHYFGGSEPLVIGHRGGTSEWPENTLFAFEHSISKGVDVIETDVRASLDGELFLMHDSTVDRTTNGKGVVELLSSEFIGNLRVKHSDPNKTLFVPTIDEFLTRTNGTRLNIEMKDFRDEFAKKLCEKIKEYNRVESVLVASQQHHPMSAFRKACPKVATSATFREVLMFYWLKKMRLIKLYRSPAVAFQVPDDERIINSEMFEALRSFNLRIHVWTIDSSNDMRRLLEMGVDGLITNETALLQRILNESTN